ADVPASAARPKSPPTSPCSPPRSTWPVSACSAYGTPAAGAPPPPHDHRNSLLGSSFSATSAQAASASVRRIPPDTNRHNRQNRSADNTYPTKPVWHPPPRPYRQCATDLSSEEVSEVSRNRMGRRLPTRSSSP